MKAKFKINQLAAQPINVELVHPVAGPTGIFVKMCGPHSSKLKAALEVYNKIDSPTEAESIQMFASSLMGWDEDAFEMPFSDANAALFLSQAENRWIVDQIAPMSMDRNKFFRVEDREVV